MLDRLLSIAEENDEERFSSKGDDFHDHIDTSYRYSLSGRRILLAPMTEQHLPLQKDVIGVCHLR